MMGAVSRFVRLALLLLFLFALALPAVLLAAPGDDEAAPAPPAAAGGDDDPPAAAARRDADAEPAPPPPSRAAGLPWRGRLIHGRQLPPTGDGFATWDPILKRVGNRRGGAGARTACCRRCATCSPPMRAGTRRPAGAGRRPLTPARRRLRAALRRHRPRLAPERARRRRLLPAARRPAAPRAPARPGRPRGRAGVGRRCSCATGPQYVFVGPSLGLRGPRRSCRCSSTTTTTCICGSGRRGRLRQPPVELLAHVALDAVEVALELALDALDLAVELLVELVAGATSIAYMPPSTTSAKTVSIAAIGSRPERRNPRPQ